MLLKNIINIIKATDSIMIARGDLAIDIGHSEVPKVQLKFNKKMFSIFKISHSCNANVRKYD